MPRILFIFLILVAIQIGSSEVYAQNFGPSQQVEIVDLDLPNTIQPNSSFYVSGYFKNVGSTEVKGNLGLQLESANTTGGSQPSFSIAIQPLENVTINPGDQIYFSIEVDLSTTTTTSSVNNIAIVFPLLDGTVLTNPVYKNLTIESSTTSGN